MTPIDQLLLIAALSVVAAFVVPVTKFCGRVKPNRPLVLVVDFVLLAVPFLTLWVAARMSASV